MFSLRIALIFCFLVVFSYSVFSESREEHSSKFSEKKDISSGSQVKPRSRTPAEKKEFSSGSQVKPRSRTPAEKKEILIWLSSQATLSNSCGKEGDSHLALKSSLALERLRKRRSSLLASQVKPRSQTPAEKKEILIWLSSQASLSNSCGKEGVLFWLSSQASLSNACGEKSIFSF